MTDAPTPTHSHETPLTPLDARKTATTLVFLHAFPLDARQFAPQLDAFRDLNAFALDLPGFGGSPLDSHFTVERAASHVASTLDELQVSRAILCGVSLGGYVALALARLRPTLLQALILADTRADADSPEARQKRDENSALIERDGTETFIEKSLANLLGDTTRRERSEVVAQVREIGMSQSQNAIIAALGALRDRPDATPHLAQISVPTLVLRGEEDAVTPLQAMQDMADAIPGARFQAIPNAGHLSNIENPGAFNDAVAAFVREVTA